MAKTPQLSRSMARKSSGVVSRAGGGKGASGGYPTIKTLPAHPANGGTSGKTYRGKPKSGQLNGMC